MLVAIFLHLKPPSENQKPWKTRATVSLFGAKTPLKPHCHHSPSSPRLLLEPDTWNCTKTRCSWVELLKAKPEVQRLVGSPEACFKQRLTKKENPYLRRTHEHRSLQRTKHPISRRAWSYLGEAMIQAAWPVRMRWGFDPETALHHLKKQQTIRYKLL